VVEHGLTLEAAVCVEYGEKPLATAGPNAETVKNKAIATHIGLPEGFKIVILHDNQPN
jgi:hypothetical protein